MREAHTCEKRKEEDSQQYAQAAGPKQLARPAQAKRRIRWHPGCDSWVRGGLQVLVRCTAGLQSAIQLSCTAAPASGDSAYEFCRSCA